MGNIFVLSAPSGTGKTTLVRRLRKSCRDLAVSISYTTRKPRPGETDGLDYNFITISGFKKKLTEGFFAEWACVYGNYYGTSRKFLDDNLSGNKKSLLTIDTQGGLQIRKLYPETVLIGILPPSLDEQKRRLLERGESAEEMKRRLREASEERKILFMKYDYRLVNRDVDRTAVRLVKIMEKHIK